MVHEHDALITNYSHLAHLPRSPDALHTLRRISTMVKPLMRRRGWRVAELAEFYPPQANLLGLNWNHGAKICLRLRYPTDSSQFMPFENVLDTMLHELAHIEHGPHDQAFHALWDALRDEYEALLRKGYTGEGFLSKGQRLGGGRGSGRMTASAVAEAERRRRQNTSGGAGTGVGTDGSGSGGRRLGGRRANDNEDIRAVIAAAAERRKEITRGCGSGTAASGELVAQVNRNGFRTQAEEDEANEQAIMDAVMDLIAQEERERMGEMEGYEPVSAENPAGMKGTDVLPAAGTVMGGTRAPPAPYSPPPVPLATKPRFDDRVSVGGSAAAASAASAASAAPMRATTGTDAAGEEEQQQPGWTCATCTLHNQPNHLCCDACGSERPSALTAADYRDDTRLIDLTARASAAAQRPENHQDPGGAVSGRSTRGGGGLAAKRPAPAASSSSSSSSTQDSRVLRPRVSSAAQLEGIAAAAERRKREQGPIGWSCGGCGSFMEAEWWTCSLCGRLKERS